MPAIKGTKLPSYRQAFGYFLHEHTELGKSVKESMKISISAVLQVWEKASLPTRQTHHCIKKLEDFFDTWKGLRKHATRQSEAHKKKEEEFVARLDDLFDIAHADVEKMVKYRQDFEFLQLQRQKGRHGSIGGVDKVHMKKVDSLAKRLAQGEVRKKRSVAEVEMATSTAVLESSSSSSEENTPDEIEIEGACGGPIPKKRRRVKNAMTPELAAALDRTQTSSRSAAYLLSGAASSFGVDPVEFNINPASIHRQRKKFRAKRAEQIKSRLLGDSPLTVHWDGKMMEDLTSLEHVDRLPILISCAGEEQLLGVPKLPKGSGEAQAKAVMDCLEDWGLVERVKALSFDTTASNTGRKGGTCALIEAMMDTNLLFLACRHHVMELVIGAAFDAALGVASTGEKISVKTTSFT